MAARKTRGRRSGPRGWVARGGSGQRPALPLAFLAGLIVVLYGVMFGIGNLTPRLAIDLAGGTSAIYTASPAPGTHAIPPGAVGEAVTIMQERVNAFGVSEAQVSQQGSNTIQVEIPGHNSQDLVNQIGSTARLYFRPVLQEAQATPATTPSPTTSGSPSGSASPSASSSSTAKASASASPSASAKASGQAESMQKLSDAASASGSASPAASAGAAASGSPAASATPSPSSTGGAAAASETAAEAAYANINCATTTATKAAALALPADYIATCDTTKQIKYLLGPSEVSGTDVKSAQSVPVTANGTVTGAWQVVLNFDAKGTKDFATATQQLYSEYSSQSGSGQFAIVLDGVVQSAPAVNQGAITGGQAQITGQFTQSQTDTLATVLNYGALPLQFSVSQVSIVSPTLGGDALQGGLIAGAIGLALVFLYVILYYRGLSAVAISSLVIAAMVTYASAVLLGPLMGFTLSLAGVAGLIVAIGITADSFVVFFERLRDEVREGRTLRTAVEHGWTRARRTIVASDFVSFLAAAVLYLMSIGSVKGFAFTLGLTTVIDILVVFTFTKPLITILGRTEFFGGGHPWSGLDPERLGGKRSGWSGSGSAKRVTIAERRRAEQAAAQAGGGDQAKNSDETKRVEA